MKIMFCIQVTKEKKKEWFKVLLPVCLFFLKVLLQLWTRVGPHLGLTISERQSKDPDEGWGRVYKRDLDVTQYLHSSISSCLRSNFLLGLYHKTICRWRTDQRGERGSI